MTEADEDDDFESLLADFNTLDEDDFFDAADGAFLESISTNLREAAGLDSTQPSQAPTTWQAPAAPGLSNSGLAAQEAVESAKRREVAKTRTDGEEALWNELASPSPERRPTQLKQTYPNTAKLVRQPSGRMNITTSDNLLEAIEAEAKRLAKTIDKSQAAVAADAFDALAAHARAAPRLEKEPLQGVLADVAATGEEAQNLLRLVVTRRQGLSPEAKLRTTHGALA